MSTILNNLSIREDEDPVERVRFTTSRSIACWIAPSNSELRLEAEKIHVTVLLCV